MITLKIRYLYFLIKKSKKILKPSFFFLNFAILLSSCISTTSLSHKSPVFSKQICEKPVLLKETIFLYSSNTSENDIILELNKDLLLKTIEKDSSLKPEESKALLLYETFENTLKCDLALIGDNKPRENQYYIEVNFLQNPEKKQIEFWNYLSFATLGLTPSSFSYKLELNARIFKNDILIKTISKSQTLTTYTHLFLLPVMAFADTPNDTYNKIIRSLILELLNEIET